MLRAAINVIERIWNLLVFIIHFVYSVCSRVVLSFPIVLSSDGRRAADGHDRHRFCNRRRFRTGATGLDQNLSARRDGTYSLSQCFERGIISAVLICAGVVEINPDRFLTNVCSSNAQRGSQGIAHNLLDVAIHWKTSTEHYRTNRKYKSPARMLVISHIGAEP